MDSKRQQIVDQILTRMRLIKTADGYKTDLGNNVGEWETNWAENELPALSVCDLISDEDWVNGSIDAPSQLNKLPVMLKIFVRSAATAKDLRNMIADIYRAIRLDSSWTGLALYTKPKRSGMEITPEVFELGGAAVEIEICYLTETFNADV